MNTRAEKIKGIIEKRNANCNRLEQLIQLMSNARLSLSNLKKVIEESSKSLSPDVLLKVPNLKNRIFEIDNQAYLQSQELEKVLQHFRKDTLTVAVAGLAGQGKSRFLQSVTGLTDAQIPSGQSGACTSARSIMRHTEIDNGYARVFYHNRETMFKIILNYYRLLGWKVGSVSSFEDFKSDFVCQPQPETLENKQIYDQLKCLYEQIDDYERDIFCQHLSTKEISLDEIKNYVTYQAGKMRSDTFVVDRVEVFCKFNSTDVGQLSLIDTPGMNAGSQVRDREILLDVLNEEADFVIFITIPNHRGLSHAETVMQDDCNRHIKQAAGIGLERKSFWLLNQAKIVDSHGTITQDGTGKDNNSYWFDEELPSGMLITADLVQADVSDSNQVREKVLDPMINYLVEKLPTMDKEELDAVDKKTVAIKNSLSDLVKAIRNDLEISSTADGDDYKDFIDCFEELFPELSGKLQRYVNQYKKDHLIDEDDVVTANSSENPIAVENPFKDKVVQICEQCEQSIPTTFTIEFVEKEVNRSPGQGGAAFFNLLSYLRCYVRDCFGGLENACREMVDSAKDGIVKILSDPIPTGGGLLRVKALHESGVLLRSGAFFNALARVAQMSTRGNHCAELSKQLQSFADFKLLFSGFIEHQVALALDSLRLETYKNYYETHIDFSSVASIHSALLALGRRAANDVACSLVLHSATAPACAIFAVLENFVDRTLRKRGLEEQWRDLYEVVRVEVWPEVFDPNSEGRQSLINLHEKINAVENLSR